jgi:hypothetical protein
VTAEDGPAHAIWSDEWARQQVIDAVILIAEEYAATAEAAGWVPHWEDPYPYVFPVVRRLYSFARDGWSLRMVAMAGPYWGGIEVSASLTNAV